MLKCKQVSDIWSSIWLHTTKFGLIRCSNNIHLLLLLLLGRRLEKENGQGWYDESCLTQLLP